MSLGLLALITTTAPLVAFVLAFVFFRKNFHKASRIVIGAGVVTAAGAIGLLLAGPQAEPIRSVWLTSGTTQFTFGFILDGLTLLMGCIVAIVALCVQIYSLGYMAHDPGRARFFAFLSLFSWAMLSFVYASSLLQAFIFWELVGLCSFLLIGFWYEKPSAIAAAKKAFIMTRIGDVGLFIGLVLLLSETGTLDIWTIIHNPLMVAATKTDLICLLLFAGIVGKSAQFPLHTWLPDAMEGPTPVSALLHSATMVAAGVFLYARFFPLFETAELAREIVLGIATFTAVFAATMAMVATDIKKVLAYSSISQLGYMLMGLGAGGYFAGVFHLTTHAAFKALLFLCAGALIHYAGSNDMVTIGRETKGKMGKVKWALLIGGAALAGIPPLAGFFSKEAIIHQLSNHPVYAAGAYLGAFLTAYYSARMVCLVWFPNPESEAQAEAPDLDHAHRGALPKTMLRPILLLAFLAAVLGFDAGLIGNLIGVDAVWPGFGALPAVLTAAAGATLGWMEFGKAGSRQTGFISRAMPELNHLFENRWYINAFYNKVIAGGTIRLAKLIFKTETRTLDPIGDAVAHETGAAGRILAQTQTGRVQAYLTVAVVTVLLLVIYLGLEVSA